jgi:hypothetical protein
MAVDGYRQGRAQRTHGGGLNCADALAKTVAGEELNIVQVGDRVLAESVVTPERYLGR